MIHLTEIEDCCVLEVGILKQSVGFLTRIDPISDLRHVKDNMRYPIKGSTIQGSRQEARHIPRTMLASSESIWLMDIC